MIGTISIQINAANPNLPLKTLFAFVDSPSSLRIIDVPKKIGKWNITAVRVQATYPDNSIVSSSCVLTGGCWTCTIGGSTSVGKSLNGYAILADGTDENGQAVEGYVLGKGDVVIIDADVRTAVGDKMYYLHLLDAMPDDPKKGDVVQTGDNWLIYDGNDWVLFGGATWGQITGDITEQSDLNQKFSDVDSSIDTLQSQIDNNTSDISRIDQAITPTAPSTEASDDALAGAKSTAEFVNSSINNFAAFYITMDAAGNAFPSKTSLLDATVFYSGGEQRVPTKNDYCIVLADGSHPTALGEPTTRYTYQGTYPDGQWDFQYIVNNTSMTQAQINAINSGITAQKVAKIDDATTQEYVDTQISSVLSQTSKCVYLKKNNTIYGNQGFQRDGDYAVDWQDSTPVSVPGRPNVTDVLANISFKRAQASESGQIIAYPVTMRIPDSVWSVKTLGDGKTWYPSTALGTLYSEWSYTDTLSARAMISANVKSPYVQKNQLSNVNVFSGKYEDGSTFEISCLGTM